MINSLLSNKWIFWFYALFIVLLVVLPINSTGELNDINIITFRGDYFFHVLVFIPWSFFQPALRNKTITWLLLGLIFASATESLQYLLPYRAWNINDLLANILGVILGFVLYKLFRIMMFQIQKQ